MLLLGRLLLLLLLRLLLVLLLPQEELLLLWVLLPPLLPPPMWVLLLLLMKLLLGGLLLGVRQGGQWLQSLLLKGQLQLWVLPLLPRLLLGVLLQLLLLGVPLLWRAMETRVTRVLLLPLRVLLPLLVVLLQLPWPSCASVLLRGGYGAAAEAATAE